MGRRANSTTLKVGNQVGATNPRNRGCLQQQEKAERPDANQAVDGSDEYLGKARENFREVCHQMTS